MAEQTIDSLVVTLGLNASEFQKGITQAGEGLLSFTAKVAGMFFAVRGIEDVIGHFKELSQQLFHLGIDARNLGVAGTSLSQWGEVARLAGGHAEDAMDSIQGLNNAIFNLKYNGELASSLQMLQRFNIPYLRRGPNGEMEPEDYKAIMRMAAARAQQLEPNNSGLRYEVVRGMGFTGGLASAIAEGGKKLEEYLATAAKDQKPLTEQVIESQVKLNQSVISLQSAFDAQASALLSKVTPALESLTGELHTLTGFISNVTGMFKANFGEGSVPAKVGHAVGGFFADLHDGITLGPLGHVFDNLMEKSGRAQYASLFASLEQKYHLPKGLLDAEATTESGYNATKLGALGERGFFQLRPEYFPNAGAAPGTDAETAAAYLAKLYQQFGSWDAAIQAYNEGPGNYAQGKRVPGYLSKVQHVMATPTAARPKSDAAPVDFMKSEAQRYATQVQIDNMTINTQATDANGIAADIDGALTRKLIVANADPGMR